MEFGWLEDGPMGPILKAERMLPPEMCSETTNVLELEQRCTIVYDRRP